MDYHEGLLPSGRAVRVRRLTTKDKLAIDDRCEQRAIKAKQERPSTSMTLTETLLTCIDSYTDPQELKYTEIVEGEGDDAKTVKVIDVDAVLDAIPAHAWHKTGYLELSTSGPKSLTDTFDSLADFNALVVLVSIASGKGMEKVGTLAGKVRQTSGA